MAGSVNKVILLGRLGRDPELKYTGSGTPFCKFSIATEDSWKDKGSGEAKKNTEWHNCVAWDKLAEIANQYLAKGRQVYIEGQLQTREYDAQDGTKKKSTEIRVRELVFIGGRGEGGGGADDEGAGEHNASSTKATTPPPGWKGGGGGSPITDEDVPF